MISDSAARMCRLTWAFAFGQTKIAIQDANNPYNPHRHDGEEINALF